MNLFKSPRLIHHFLVIGLIVVVSFIFLNWLHLYKSVLVAAVAPFFWALVIAYILNPLVNFFVRYNIPRTISVLILYGVFFGIIVVLFISFFPAIMEELRIINQQLPEYSAKFIAFIEELQQEYHSYLLPESIRFAIDDAINDIEFYLLNYFDGLSGYILETLDSALTFILTPILVFYLLKDFPKIKDQLSKMIPNRMKFKLFSLVEEIDDTLGSYIKGLILVSLILGLLSYIGFLILGLEFALLLGIISAVTNIIPYFGPLIGAVPAIIIAFLDGPLLALKVTILIIVVQQVESQLISPFILGGRLQMHPLSIIFFLILGGRLFGLPGLLLAIPVSAMGRIIIKHVRTWQFNS